MNCSFSVLEFDFEIEHVTDSEKISVLESPVSVLENKAVIENVIIKKLQSIVTNLKAKIDELKHDIKNIFKQL